MNERILLFIPAYNCAPQIPRVIAQLTPETRAQITETIIVNNRSTDDTENAARAAQTGVAAKILRNDGNYGSAAAQGGVQLRARQWFRLCIVLHGDVRLDRRSRRISRRAPRDDCLLGARFMKGSRLSGYSLFRTFGIMCST